MQKTAEIEKTQNRIVREAEKKFGLKPVAVACNDEDIFLCTDVPKARRWKGKGKGASDYVFIPGANEKDTSVRAVRLDSLKEIVAETCSWMKLKDLDDVKCAYLLSTSMDDQNMALDPRIALYVKVGKQTSPLFIFTLQHLPQKQTADAVEYYTVKGDPETVYTMYMLGEKDVDKDILLQVLADRLNDASVKQPPKSNATIMPPNTATFENVYIGRTGRSVGRLRKSGAVTGKRGTKDTDAS